MAPDCIMEFVQWEMTTLIVHYEMLYNLHDN